MWPFPAALVRGIAPTGHADRAPLTVDHAGWLWGPAVERHPSVRHSARPHGVSSVVWHATSCAPGTPLWRRIRTYRPGVDRAASWHVIVEADGRIYQSVSLERAAWHCRGRNADSIGIELAAGDDYDARAWPAAQVDAARELVAVLVDHYPIAREHAGLLHSELDPARRGDPGRTWAALLPGLLDGAYGR